MKKTWFFAATVIGWAVLSSIALGATYGGGAGTFADPYQIWTPQQMNTIGANSGDWGKCFKLMADIDMSAYTGTQYKIIGNSTTKFTGVFDGNGYIIFNLSYVTTSYINYVGLFGLTNNAAIKNLGLENVNISIGGSYAGGLVGYSAGTITNCYSTGLVSGISYVGGLVGWQNSGTITHCCSTESVVYTISSDSSYSYAGGLVGCQWSGTIAHCYSTASVASSGYCFRRSLAGGLVGLQEEGIITDCCSTGSVTAVSFPIGDCSAGGLVGWQVSGTITHCYSTGAVTTSGSGLKYMGGLVGQKYGGSTADSFWDTETSGQTTSAGGEPKTTAEMKTLTTFTVAMWDFTNESINGTNDYWRMCVNDVDYPRLNWESIDGDFACPDGVSTEDLDYFVGRWLLDNCTSSNNYCGGGDVDASGRVDLGDFAILAGHWMEGI